MDMASIIFQSWIPVQSPKVVIVCGELAQYLVLGHIFELSFLAKFWGWGGPVDKFTLPLYLGVYTPMGYKNGGTGTNPITQGLKGSTHKHGYQAKK